MLDALRTAALANPDDLTTLRIYADALIELGDPEGERILLTVNDEFPLEATWRDDHLLGRLRRAVRGCTVFRGLLWDVTLARVTPREFTRLIGRPEWRTVRTLHFLRGRLSTTQSLPAWECAQLVSHPVMESLRQVTGFDLRALELLGGRHRPVPIEGINVRCIPYDMGPEGPLDALPSLRRLALNDCTERTVGPLLAAPFWRRLRTLELSFHHGRVPARSFAPLLLADSQLEFVRFGPCTAVRERDGWSLTIDATGLWAEALVIELEQVGERISRLDLVTSGLEDEARTELMACARRFHWELHLDDVPAGPWQRLDPEPDIPF